MVETIGWWIRRKRPKGIYPTSANFSTDLHSLGQFIQEGTRIMFETVVRVDKPRKTWLSLALEEDLDGLGYLQGKDVDFVNKKQLTVFFLPTQTVMYQTCTWLFQSKMLSLLVTQSTSSELTIALSGYLNAINPFDQPGVEAYKRNMFAPSWKTRIWRIEQRT